MLKNLMIVIVSIVWCLFLIVCGNKATFVFQFGDKHKAAPPGCMLHVLLNFLVYLKLGISPCKRNDFWVNWITIRMIPLGSHLLAACLPAWIFLFFFQTGDMSRLAEKGFDLTSNLEMISNWRIFFLPFHRWFWICRTLSNFVSMLIEFNTQIST